jgi:CheY-like chemotaxis protein
MSRTGPIIVVDDDKDDHDIIADALRSLKISNKVKFFERADDVLHYLRTTTDNPFIIICDINLPFMNGLEMRREINNDEFLRRKSIPFIFLTTSPDQRAIAEAYDLMVQGFFIKRDTFDEIKESMRMIIGYWLNCLHPNSGPR